MTLPTADADEAAIGETVYYASESTLERIGPRDDAAADGASGSLTSAMCPGGEVRRRPGARYAPIRRMSMPFAARRSIDR